MRSTCVHVCEHARFIAFFGQKRACAPGLSFHVDAVDLECVHVRIAGWRRISLWRRPLPKKALRRFTVSFIKKEIELAGARVGIHLLIPSSLFAELKPLDDMPILFRGQSLYSRFDLLNSTHA